jgi:outer membrane protein TolC
MMAYRWRILLPILTLSTGLLMAASMVWAEPVLTLNQAVAIAFEKSPLLEASRNEVDAASARLTQATAAYYPQLNVVAGYDRTWSDTVVGPTVRDANEGVDDYSAGVNLNQYLFDFGKTPAQVEKSRQNKEVSGKNFDSLKISLVRDVKLAYFEILKNQQLVLVAQENVALQEQQLKQARAIYSQGMRPKIDVTRAEVQISQAALSLLNARYGLQRSVIAFETILGGPPVAGAYTLAEENPEPDIQLVLDVLVETAIRKRPELMGINAQIKSSEAALLSAKRSAFPGLTASGSYHKSGDELPIDEDRWQVGLSLNWSLFTGFRRSGQAAESKADVNRYKAQYVNRRLVVTEEVTRAFLLVQATGEAIKTSEMALRQAKENLAMAEGRYKTGVSDAIELSDAQVLYTESRSSLVQSIYEQYKAYAELEYAVGGSFNGNEVP